MSGVYIKGMQMPKSCYDCPLQDDECFGSIKCSYVKTWGSANMRAVDCPLIPVPDHGRLIEKHDVFKLISSFPEIDKLLTVEFMKALYNLPALIPADESDMDSFIRIFEEDDEEDGMDSFIQILKD